jgi:hypothetical protein
MRARRDLNTGPPAHEAQREFFLQLRTGVCFKAKFTCSLPYTQKTPRLYHEGTRLMAVDGDSRTKTREYTTCAKYRAAGHVVKAGGAHSYHVNRVS